MAYNPESLKNLKHFTSAQDKTAARENGRVGGLRSGEVRRAKAEARIRAIEKEFDETVLHPHRGELQESIYAALTYKQQKFIRFYIESLYSSMGFNNTCSYNGAQAALRAGYTKKNPRSAASSLLHKADVYLGLLAYHHYFMEETGAGGIPYKHIPATDIKKYKGIRIKGRITWRK